MTVSRSHPTLGVSTNRPSWARPHRGMLADDARAFRAPSCRVVENSGDHAVVELYDEIGGFGVYAREFNAMLAEVDGENKTVEIRVNSPGGDVFEGLAIATAMSRMSATVEVVVDGLAASMAALITVAADQAKMAQGSMMMIHRALILAIGQAPDLEKAAELLRKLDKQGIDALSTKAGDKTDRATVEQMVDAETWLSDEETIAAGFADGMLDQSRPAPSARACAAKDLRAQFPTAPESAVALLGDRSQTDNTGIDMTDKTDQPKAPETGGDETAGDKTEPQAQGDQEKTPAAPTLSKEDTETIRNYASALKNRGLSDADARVDSLIAANVSVDRARAALFDALVAGDDAESIDNTSPATASKPDANPAQKQPTFNEMYRARAGQATQ